MSDDAKQACPPPDEQDTWIREAAATHLPLDRAIGQVMRRSNGRCNPDYVAREIQRLRREHVIAHRTGNVN